MTDDKLARLSAAIDEDPFDPRARSPRSSRNNSSDDDDDDEHYDDVDE